MTSALLFHNESNPYINWLTVAIVNVVICFILVRFCAFKWFRLDFNKVGFVVNGTWSIGICSGVIIFGILFIYSLCLNVNFSVPPFDKWGVTIFNALVNRGISTAFGEELIFRGFLFSLIFKLTNLSRATIILATIPYPQLFNLVLVVSCCIVRVLVT